VKANDITDGNDSDILMILLIFTISGGPLSYQQIGASGERQCLK